MNGKAFIIVGDFLSSFNLIFQPHAILLFPLGVLDERQKKKLLLRREDMKCFLVFISVLAIVIESENRFKSAHNCYSFFGSFLAKF